MDPVSDTTSRDVIRRRNLDEVSATFFGSEQGPIGFFDNVVDGRRCVRRPSSNTDTHRYHPRLGRLGEMGHLVRLDRLPHPVGGIGPLLKLGIFDENEKLFAPIPKCRFT